MTFAFRDLPGTELVLPVLGTFPGEQSVLFLGVTVTAELLSSHAAIHAGIEQRGDAGVSELYRPGCWVPHCTLALGLDANELKAAIDCLHPCSVLSTRVAQVSLVEIETGRITPVA